MKRKCRKGLAVALAFVLMGAACMLPVIPVSAETGTGEENTEIKKIVVKVQTSDSITLSAEDNYEYAIETEKSKENSTENGTDKVRTWKWAEKDQYDRTNKTVIFRGLQADTQYRFAYRLAGSTEAVNPIFVETLKKAAEDLTPEGENTPISNVSDNSQEGRDGVDTEAGQPADHVPEMNRKKELGVQNLRSVLPKSDPPSGSEVKDVEITLKDAPDKPQYMPELAGKTDTVISLKAAEGEIDPGTLEFGMRTSVEETIWNTTGVFENLVPGDEYQFVTRRKVDEKEQKLGPSSDVLKVTTLQSAAVAPAVPELQKRTDTSISLKAFDQQQYAILMADGSAVWQDSAEFDGLTPNTEYSFITRMKYNPDTAMESIPSGTAVFKTVIRFEGAKVTGITPGGSYEEGTSLTFTAEGVGMENASPLTGDTRWAPKSWSWDGKSFENWDKEPYSYSYKYTIPGNYKLRVVFQREEWIPGGWASMGESNMITTEFKITAKKVIYTITAEAGANGKIEPKGSVDVEKGKDCEFKFTPDKGFRVSKVTVDGKAVSASNNRYTLSNVQGNHKIYVTFEKDNRTPKTGDTTKVALFGGLVTVSAVLILMLVYRKRKHL